MRTKGSRYNEILVKFFHKISIKYQDFSEIPEWNFDKISRFLQEISLFRRNLINEVNPVFCEMNLICLIFKNIMLASIFEFMLKLC